jgi:hypothetical protein
MVVLFKVLQLVHTNTQTFTHSGLDERITVKFSVFHLCGMPSTCGTSCLAFLYAGRNNAFQDARTLYANKCARTTTAALLFKE